MLHLHDSRIVIANMSPEEKNSNERGGWVGEANFSTQCVMPITKS